MQYFLWACALGALSAVSLPLGSWFGLRFKFTPNQIAILAAFGAGALLAALSVELVAPTTLALIQPEDGEAGHKVAEFYALVIGCVLGGFVYVLLDNVVNKQGGFLRKTSTLLRYYKSKGQKERDNILEKVSEIALFHDFPPDHVETLLKYLEPVTFKDKSVIIKQGEAATAAYILLEGNVEVEIEGQKHRDFTSNDALIGIIPLLFNTPNLGTLTSKGEAKFLRISRQGFEKLRELSPEFEKASRNLASERLEEFEKIMESRAEQVKDWIRTSKDALTEDGSLPTVLEMRKMKEEHHGAPLAVWLGILLDGIPESLVIGAGMLGLLTAKLAAGQSVGFIDVIPFTLIAGLFLSNFPEALSSSANMLAQGWSKRKVFLMWFSLMVITGIGAGIGYLAAGQLDHTWMVLFEGLAAGAMLTMIAAAMIPEAVIMGSGNLVGISTLAGFLAAILFKLLE